MTKPVFYAALIMSCVCGVSIAGTISFDDLPAGPLFDQYKASEGVVFSTVEYDSISGVITPSGEPAQISAAIGGPNGTLPVSSPHVVMANGTTPAAMQRAILIEFFIPAGNPNAGQAGVTNRVSISTDALTFATDPEDDRDDAVNLFALGESGQILAVAACFDTEQKVLTIDRGANYDISKAILLFRAAPSSADIEGYDNLSFGTPTPEPATLAIMFGGMLMFGPRRRAR